MSAVPFGPGIDIWRSSRYIGALFRALVGLPRGIRMFVSCDIGANHCRLRHLGWEKCGHGLTLRPRESASEGFLNELLVLFGYSSGSASVLVESSPFGVVLIGLLVGFPLGVFLFMVMSRVLLLSLLGFRMC